MMYDVVVVYISVGGGTLEVLRHSYLWAGHWVYGGLLSACNSVDHINCSLVYCAACYRSNLRVSLCGITLAQPWNLCQVGQLVWDRDVWTTETVGKSGQEKGSPGFFVPWGVGGGAGTREPEKDKGGKVDTEKIGTITLWCSRRVW